MSDQVTKSITASIRARLQNAAREREEAFDLVLTRYALERFLFRLSQTDLKQKLILKGAMLFQLWSDESLRATRDMDFLARGEGNAEAIAQDIRTICAVQAAQDGLDFDLSKLSIGPIREESEYGGMRAKFTAKLGNARIPMQLDFGVGDAVTPSPTKADYPSLLGMDKPNILVYPRETAIAEKLETIVKLGLDNSRMKDYFDLWFLAKSEPCAMQSLALAIKNTFERRGTIIPSDTPPGLSDDFARSEGKRKQWTAFQRRVTNAQTDLDDVVNVIRQFAMPIFHAARAL